jgi:hypothetical protein
MNPQPTRTRAIGPDPVFFALYVPAERPTAPREPRYAAPVQTVHTSNAVLESAERERMDSLALLHALVMG